MMFYNAWRLYSLKMVYDYLIESFPSYEIYHYAGQGKKSPIKDFSRLVQCNDVAQHYSILHG